jgi:hypothetical protein
MTESDHAQGAAECCPTCGRTDAEHKVRAVYTEGGTHHHLCRDPWHGDDHLRHSPAAVEPEHQIPRSPAGNEREQIAWWEGQCEQLVRENERLVGLVERCRDMLDDVPGNGLEEKLTKLIGDYLALQIMLSESRAQVEGLPASIALALSSEREKRVVEQHNDFLPIYLCGFDEATEAALAAASISSTDRPKAIDVEQIEQSQDKPLRFIIVRSATNPNPDIFGKAPPGCESFRVTSTSTEPPIDTFIHAPSLDRAKAIVRSLFAGATFSDGGAFLR